MPEVMIAPQSSPPWGRLPAAAGLVLLALLAQAVPAAALEIHPFESLPQRAQRVTLRRNTSFYAEPNGVLLGTLRAGAQVTYGRTRQNWRQVTFEGWIYTPSTGPSPHRQFTLAVSARGGENLRKRPDGELIARAIRGTGFTRVSRQGRWTRVRRTAWVFTGTTPMPSRETRIARSETAPPPVGEAAADTADSAAAEAVPPTIPVVQATADRVVIRKGALISIGPGAAEVGLAPEEIPGEVTGRAGNWVRVRTETWVRSEDLRPTTPEESVTLAQLRAEPEKLVGQAVTWRLQFLSVQRADELRPEIPPGQPYLLTRGPLPEVGFVYVVVTPEQAQQFRSMNPLDEFVARGKIVAGRTRHLPTPVIQLDRLDQAREP
jgi:hypothetical protein